MSAIAQAPPATVAKRAPAGAADDCSASKKRKTAGAAAATSAAPPAMPWMAPPWMAPPPLMMMPPFLPPPFMAMQACMMMQMQMQAMQAQAAADGSKLPQPTPAPEPSKPTAATVAAAALGLPEGLPQYPAFPFPAAAAMPFAFPPPAAAAHSAVQQQQQQQQVAPQRKPATESLAALPDKDLEATNLSDKDFAAFIDSFVSDGPSPTDISSEGASGSSSDEDFCLDDLLPLDAVLAHDIAVSESGAAHVPAAQVASQAASLLDLDDLIDCGSTVATRAHDHPDAGEDLIIFDGAASDACETSWIFAA